MGVMTESDSLARRKSVVGAISFGLVVLGTAILAWMIGRVLSGNVSFANDVCLPSAVGISLIAVGTFARTRWCYFMAWSALALTSQAAALQLIFAGKLIHFQHYRPISEMLDQKTIALAFLAAQVICVAVGIWLRRTDLREWLGQFAWWQLALFLLVLTLSGAALTPDASIYITSLATATLVQLTSIANVILLVRSIPATDLERIRQKLNKFLTRENAAESTTVGLDRFSWIVALAVVVLTASLSYFVYQAHPHVPDESQYIFQANYMAAGQLTVQPPKVPEAFSMYMIPTYEPRWFGIFPPAWPSLLALGTLAGASWLVNPIMSGLCIILGYLFFQQLYSRTFARGAILLLACSPWFIFMGMSYMSHVATLFFSLTAALLMMRAVKEKSGMSMLLAGLAVGVVSLIRPLDGAIVGLLLALYGIFNNTTWRSRITACAVLGVGTVATSSIVFLYNMAVTGSAVLSPSDAYYNKYLWPNVMALGFGPERGMHWGLDAFAGHSPLEALVNAALNVFLLNTELFGWGIGSLCLIILLGVSRSVLKKDLWAVITIVAVVGAYSLFWYHGGPDFGARYWFLCIIPLIALTIRGAEWIGRSISASQIEKNHICMVLAVGVLCIVSLTSYVPWRASDKYHQYLGMRPGIEELAKRNDFGRSLVMVRGAEHPDYQSAWVYNPVNFEGNRPIYAFEKDTETRKRLLNEYSDRSVWIVNGPTLTNNGYSIVRGPVAASELLQEMN